MRAADQTKSRRTLGWPRLPPDLVATDIVRVEVRNSDLDPSIDPHAF
ncbi:MAG: hypothetical protein JSR91_08580 [Proteobacteria bacterium]|nr:hypothetical protein [Pseudomonadota bacterium]